MSASHVAVDTSIGVVPSASVTLTRKRPESPR